jgi:hypothetical protein
MKYDVKNIQKNNDIGKIDFKDILLEDLILNNTEMESYPNLKKWLRYQLFQSQDADVILKKSDVTLKLGWYKEESPKEIYLDCIFSMRMHLNMLLKLYNPKAINYAWLLIYFDYIINKNSIGAFSNKNKTGLINCFDEIEKFAKNTHTLGNYMPVPDKNYNATKGFFNKWSYNDRIELFLKDIFSGMVNNNNNYQSWFSDERINSLCLSGLFENLKTKEIKKTLLNFECHKKTKFEVDDINKFSEYLKFVNQWIEDRTDVLIGKINENSSTNSNLTLS